MLGHIERRGKSAFLMTQLSKDSPLQRGIILELAEDDRSLKDQSEFRLPI